MSRKHLRQKRKTEKKPKRSRRSKRSNTSHLRRRTRNRRGGVFVRNPKVYKTTLCRHWRQGRDCPHGKRCQHAHGAHELRVPQSPPIQATPARVAEEAARVAEEAARVAEERAAREAAVRAIWERGSSVPLTPRSPAKQTYIRPLDPTWEPPPSSRRQQPYIPPLDLTWGPP